MFKNPTCTPRLLGLLIGAIGLPHAVLAQQLPLVQYPAGSANRSPAPNVIITLDDSGSMGFYDGGDRTQDESKTTSGMYALKQALKETFSATAQHIPDGAIRLAWNTLTNCRSIPSSLGGCGGLNDMRVLDATHRNNFLNWVSEPGYKKECKTRLCAEGSTPTHHAFIAAGDYLKDASTTNINSPWASVPRKTLAPVLSCRRSYNVLMTDGGWNFIPDGQEVARGGAKGGGNADGTLQTLPDGELYDPDSAQTRLYADKFGGNATYDYLDAYGVPRTWKGNLSTLADLAFYYWATDLSSLDNDLVPTIKLSGTQTYGTGSKAVVLEEYWNPRNNPATWQHMTTYTIGFRDASTWKTDGGYSANPVWDKDGNDTFFLESISDLVTFSNGKKWPDPIKKKIHLDETSNAANNNGEARKAELWHMALNGRGKFIPATSSADLVKAFKDIFGEIVTDTKAPITSFSNSASSITRAQASQFTSGYESEGWKGYVRADTLAQSTGLPTPDATWGTKTVEPPALANLTTADKLDALNATQITNRLILSWRDKVQGGGGALFEWASNENNLSTAQKNLIKGSTADTAAANLLGQQRLNFIRGDRSLESTTMRQRVSRHGDIVNSQLWYVAQPVSNYSFDAYLAFARKHAKRLPMVYVGGNDGMLHGFSGVDGSEKIAYVPKGVIQNLPELTRTGYQHRYYVDGSPFSGDVYASVGGNAEPEWQTLLVGTLGAGGKGYFVLNVTNPGSTATDKTALASDMLKSNAASLVVMDKTAHKDVVFAAASAEADIGHIMVEPVLEDGNPQKTTQIVRMNNGRWALVMGNGYNSTNERPVLLIQYLDNSKELLTITAASSGDNAKTNGLSAPRLVDINGDGTPDVIYAGDLRGNLWKFDVMSATQSEWKVAFGTAASPLPLYTAAHVSGTVSTSQPITAPPLVRANDRGAGGLMVAFGTGRNLTEGDRTDTAVQSIYSVLDNTRYKLVGGKVVVDDSKVTPAAVGKDVDKLVQQIVGTTEISGDSASAARKFWTVSQNAVQFDGNDAMKGWYLNLPPEERLLAQMSFYDESNNIEVLTLVPGSGSGTVEESCAPPPTAQKNYRTFLNIMDGKRPSVQIIDQNGDGAYGDADQHVSRMSASPAESRVRNNVEEIRRGSDGAVDKLRRLPEIPLRPSWRQLQ